MNLILIAANEIDKDGRVTLVDRRAEHICKVIKPNIGATLSVGIINGNIGDAEILAVGEPQNPLVSLQLKPSTISKGSNKKLPTNLDITLIIALARPKVTRRLIRLCVECGVKNLHFINSYKVEKSFWQSPLLSEQKIYEQVLLGLEQSKDTQLPNIEFHHRFKPFVEDTLPSMTDNRASYVAHPYQAEVDLTVDSSFLDTNDKHSRQPILICIGPEGGFIPYEITMLNHAGLKRMGFGNRIYRVETFVPLLLGALTSR